jgi:hypothetical protein
VGGTTNKLLAVVSPWLSDFELLLSKELFNFCPRALLKCTGPVIEETEPILALPASLPRWAFKVSLLVELSNPGFSIGAFCRDWKSTSSISILKMSRAVSLFVRAFFLKPAFFNKFLIEAGISFILNVYVIGFQPACSFLVK